MSRLNQSPMSSPSIRAAAITDLPIRSATLAGASSLGESSASPTRKNLLLSENQLSNINKKLANIRHGSIPTQNIHHSVPDQQQQQQTESRAESPMSISRNTQHTLGEYPVQIQEYAMIEDLLYVLMGIKGIYIKCIHPKPLDDDSMDDVNEWTNIQYDIDPTLDLSLRHLVSKILPLATYYMSVDAFVDMYSRFEYGTINHALCSAVRVFLKEYLTLMAQLEHQFQTSPTFTLQKLWFFAQGTIQNMKVLHDLAMTIRGIQEKKSEEEDIEAVFEGLQKGNEETTVSEERKGGAILNILSDRLIGLSGDPNCKKIYTFLLSKASVPYFEILHAWIYRGEIKDPYNEFMVLEKRNVKKENLKEDFNDTYWETRYTLREGGVPSFLEDMKHRILLAGKYLNVVRECGVQIIVNPQETNQQEMEGNVGGPTRSEVWAAVDGSRFIKNLDIAYKYANQTLLNLLMQDQQLIGRLRSIKHYFFLDQSDFLTSFLDLAKDELKQPTTKIPQNRLQSLMDLVLRNPSSVAAYDPFKEDIKVSMSHLRLIDQLLRIINVSGNMEDTSLSQPSMLTGYEALILDYTVTFPLSLIISRKALTKYQLLFRHILNLKHVEDQLCDAWMDQKEKLWKRQSTNPEIEHWKFRIYSLRNRMLTFIQQFAYYVTNEVLEPNYQKLENYLMTSVSTVDQVLQYHSDFLDNCLKECMLTNAKLLRIFNKLISTCQSFAAQAENYTSLLHQLEGEQGGIIQDASVNIFETTNRSLSRMEESFLYHMKLLIEALNYYSAAETVQFLCLVVRLDYNQFYNQQAQMTDVVARKKISPLLVM